jgi:glycosyltransferase involved in cell wall biosynthesis
MRPGVIGPAPVGEGRQKATSPRVLHVSQPTDGGVRRYLVAVCADQVARGWQVAVACPEGPLAVDLDALGIPRRSWPATRSPGPSIAGETLALSRIIHDVAPDLVHLHSSKAGLVGRLVIRRRRPTIFQPHGWSWLAATSTVKWLTTRWERVASRWSTAIVCVGHDELAAGRAAGIRAPMRVVRNGVDRARFPVAGEAGKSRARRELGIPENVALVVCAGRVTRQKGQDVLLAAWPSVRAQCANAQLAIVGDGELLAELRRRADSSVRFVPPTSDIAGWLAAADVVTVPSRWEGLPLIALEAAAVGRGVVGTAVAGLTECVTPATGALVAPENPRELANALARRLCNPSLAAAEGRAAALLATQFDQQRTLEVLAQLCLALVGRVRTSERTRT